MTSFSSSKISLPLPSSVPEEAWSFCLSSRLLASFLDDPSDFCNLSTCARDFVPFRTHIRQVKHEQAIERSILTDAISSGTLP